MQQHPVRRCQQMSLTLFIMWSLFFVIISSSCGTSPTQTKQGSPISCSSHSSQPVTLTMAYSSEKQAWIEDVVKDFNGQQMTACDGPITVQATPTGSGQSMQQILDGSLQPDIWSPAGNVWITLLNAQWRSKHGSDLVGTGANDTPSLVSSPVVIAMWQPQAKALGWPQKPIGWADIVKLSTDPQGWKTYGHPEFGQFKFGHTHPEYSNSGLDAVIAMNYAATSKLRGLTVDDVNSSSTKDFVANVESSVIHYGDSTGFFADKMFRQGPSYLSATVMYENLVIEANDGKKYPHLPYPVVAIYPKEGTFNSDHPFAILQGSWVSPAKQAAAQAFRNFLLASAQQTKALQYGFRPADPNTKLAAPIDSAHGVDPTQPSTVLPIPNADVVRAIQASWQGQRRRVDVMLILDRSGSMNDLIGNIPKIDGAKSGLKEFVNFMSDQDQLGLTTFSSSADVLTPISPLGPKRQDILSRIDGINASGETLLFDTIGQQFQALQQFPSKHIKAIVVLTDGQDTKSSLKVGQLVNRVTASGEDAGEAIKIFTIAYGTDADTNALTQIASKTGGQEYSGTPQNIQEVYQQISEFF
ncbi:MAG TPA: VWA domain-containing protein [Ktedonobacteraceae bacterium]|nr:VWA domain-containing protein [Ktedonobacteraceae bacterium]